MIGEADLPLPGDFQTFHPFIKGVFTQWHPAGFELGGQHFVTAEQWMMVQKAELFGDHTRAEAIMRASSPGEQKRLGQQVSGFDQTRWDAQKLDIVYRGNFAKFSQNPGALRQLISTRDAMLVEANPRDWIWGVGLAIDDPSVHQPDLWRGTNFLGRILTLVRQRLVALPNS